MIVSIAFISINFFNIIFPLKYKNLIKIYSLENSIDAELVASIICTESRYNKDAVSNKGAVGLMQILPTTAKNFSDGDFEENDLFNPEYNLKIGLSFLKYLFGKYGDEVTVLACYNAGENVVIKWMEGEDKLEKSQIKYVETLNYVNKVQRLKKVYCFRLKYFWFILCLNACFV